MNHSCPISVLQVHLSCPANTLGLVKAEQAIIELPHDIFRTQEVIEHPLLSQTAEICPKDGGRERAKVTWLVNSN
jgi:hypothetical protein